MMADESRKLSITYSSGLIPPSDLMSTLAVFYDEIWLPCLYEVEWASDEWIESYYIENDSSVTIMGSSPRNRGEVLL